MDWKVVFTVLIIAAGVIGLFSVFRGCENDRRQALVKCIESTQKPLECQTMFRQ